MWSNSSKRKGSPSHNRRNSLSSSPEGKSTIGDFILSTFRISSPKASPRASPNYYSPTEGNISGRRRSQSFVRQLSSPKERSQILTNLGNNKLYSIPEKIDIQDVVHRIEELKQSLTLIMESIHKPTKGSEEYERALESYKNVIKQRDDYINILESMGYDQYGNSIKTDDVHYLVFEIEDLDRQIATYSRYQQYYSKDHDNYQYYEDKKDEYERRKQAIIEILRNKGYDRYGVPLRKSYFNPLF